MKRTWVIPFICITMLCMGCAGSKKMRVPLAEIDRPLVEPKGTWSAKPSIWVNVFAQDSIAYRNIGLGNLIFPSYSLTDNLSLPYIPFPYLIWQLTKSPLLDTTARYKWQFALSGGMTGYSLLSGVSGDIRTVWKKRLSPSIWYQGGLIWRLGYISHKGWTLDEPSYATNGICFQLSPKADVVSSISIYYAGNYDYHSLTIKNLAGIGSFNFHYSFSPWVSINVGSRLDMRQGAMGMGMNVGSEFYW
jgi:hypothetical protein